MATDDRVRRKKPKLLQPAATWAKPVTLAQRLEDCRLMLSIHGYLGDRENQRIRAKLARDWTRASQKAQS